MEKVKVDNLYKSFGEVEAVKHINLSIEEGQFVVILGPSGCGKTTTLRMIAGLEQPTAGDIFVEGKKVTHLHASKRDIAFVFQSFALYPHMTVYQNISFPLEAQRLSRPEIKERVMNVVEFLGIEPLLSLKPKQLSSGDMQKVALGRAMVRRPKVFLMDEPLSGLDAKLREEMRAELKRLHIEINATTIYVTHDQIEAMSMADTIVVMNDGVIQQIGSPQQVYMEPENIFVANFIGSPGMNFLPLVYTGKNTLFRYGPDQEFSHPQLSFLTQIDQKEFILGIRPEYVQISPSGLMNGEIISVEPLGYKNVYAVELPGGTRFMVEDMRTEKYSGQVKLQINWKKACFFTKNDELRIKWSQKNG